MWRSVILFNEKLQKRELEKPLDAKNFPNGSNKN